jgi:hypothetical protein
MATNPILKNPLQFAKTWATTWEKRNVEQILTLFSDDVIFTSPKSEPLGISSPIRGKIKLREYWNKALAQISPSSIFRFEITHAFASFDGKYVVVTYDSIRDSGITRACEIFHFGNEYNHLITSAEAMYGYARTRTNNNKL